MKHLDRLKGNSIFNNFSRSRVPLIQKFPLYTFKTAADNFSLSECTSGMLISNPILSVISFWISFHHNSKSQRKIIPTYGQTNISITQGE